jgi:hypothetical protein
MEANNDPKRKTIGDDSCGNDKPTSAKKYHEKKHHDPNNTKHVAYKFGIPGGAIFKRKGNVTKLIEINHKRIKPIEVTMRKDGKYNNMKHKF